MKFALTIVLFLAVVAQVEPLKCKSESGRVKGPDMTCKRHQNACITTYIDRAVQKGCGLITDQTTCDHREKRGTCACNDRNLCNGAANMMAVGKNIVLATMLTTFTMQIAS